MEGHIIQCIICPNGCPLELKVTQDESIWLKGHRCSRGFKYIQRQFPEVNILAEPVRPEISKERLAQILDSWSIQKKDCREIQNIPGSPERSLGRWAFEASKENYLLELFPLSSENKKTTVANLLKDLKDKQIPVIPPIVNRDGKIFLRTEEGLWQLTPFIKSLPLKRESYWKNAQSGAMLGQLQGRIQSLKRPENPEIFSYGDFLQDLWKKISRSDPRLYAEISPIVHKIETPFLNLLEDCPREFCHGDPHPMNVLWGEDSIHALIDWEFCGQKPLLYDAALTMGCVGSEDPRAIDGLFNQAFLGAYSQTYPEVEPWLDRLNLFTLGLRFAWLNEWLRHKDKAMEKQELQYMNILASRVCP